MRKAFVAAIVIVILAVLPGCSSDNELRSGPGCTSNDECPEGYVCANNLCAAPVAQPDAGEDAPQQKQCYLRMTSAECNTCIDTQCYPVCEVCMNNQECMSYDSCWMACKTDACEADCATKYPSGAPQLEALVACISNKCHAPCF